MSANATFAPGFDVVRERARRYGNGTRSGGADGAVPNGTIVESGDSFVVVEQGPPWLAELLYGAPEWLAWALQLALVVAVVAVAYLAWRVDVDADLVHDVLDALLVVGAIAGATWALTAWAPLPYLGDVVGGVAAGWALAVVVRRSGALEELAERIVDGRADESA